jgi:hypothetical protein
MSVQYVHSIGIRNTFINSEHWYCPATKEGGQEGYQLIGLAFLHYHQKKVESFDVDCAIPKTQKCVVTLSYSPCDDTPTAATVAVTTDGVSIWPCTPRGSMETKKSIFCKLV